MLSDIELIQRKTHFEVFKAMVIDDGLSSTALVMLHSGTNMSKANVPVQYAFMNVRGIIKVCNSDDEFDTLREASFIKVDDDTIAVKITADDKNHSVNWLITNDNVIYLDAEDSDELCHENVYYFGTGTI